MRNIEEMIGKTYYRPIPKIVNDTKEFVPEEVILTKRRNTFYWGNEQCHTSWLEENALVFFETKEECQNKCYQLNYEKGYIKIDANNICLYYKFIRQDTLNLYGELLNLILTTRRAEVDEILNVPLEQFSFNYDNKGNWTSYSYFGIKDNLQPLDEYIKEIKECEKYKIFNSECVCNNCMTYFESDDDLKDLEDEDGEFKGCPECNTDAYLMDLSDLK